MEELKILVGMVADLPGMALWIVAFYFVYKIFIVGSIYGVIRLGVKKLHDVLIKKKEADTIITEYTWDLPDKITISSDNALRLMEQALRRVAGKGLNISSGYIHEPSARWLIDAINEKEHRDELKRQEDVDVGTE